jgi:hypothetical protein
MCGCGTEVCRCRTVVVVGLLEKEDEQIDGKEDDDHDFQPEHAVVVQIASGHGVETVEFDQPLVHTRPPVLQVEPLSGQHVHPGEMPIANELRGVRDLVGQLGQVDPQLVQGP